MPHQFKLYQYWRSSCSWRVRWALTFKDLPYETEAVNLLKAEQTMAFYTKLNPGRSVPTLTIDGEPFSESIALLEWLEEQYPTPTLLPGSPSDRLAIRQLALLVASGIQPVQNLAVLNMVTNDVGERTRWAHHWIRRGLESYEILAARYAGTYSYGSQLSLADICLIPQVYNAYRFSVDMSAFPIIDRIYRSCLRLPSCKKTHPDQQSGAS